MVEITKIRPKTAIVPPGVACLDHVARKAGEHDVRWCNSCHHWVVPTQLRRDGIDFSSCFDCFLDVVNEQHKDNPDPKFDPFPWAAPKETPQNKEPSICRYIGKEPLDDCWLKGTFRCKGCRGLYCAKHFNVQWDACDNCVDYDLESLVEVEY